MIYYLLYFLGFKTWDTHYILVKKRHVNMNIHRPITNLKRIIEQITNKEFSPSPITDRYVNININGLPTTNIKILYTLYFIYSILVFLFLCTQPVYLIIKISNDFSQELFVTLLMNLITPLNYSL